ncbi:MAG: bi-domain-containing oxidoreductase [candidate division WOR-3 bacterium]
MRKVIVRSGGVEVVDVPEPFLGPGEVLVRTEYSLLSSGTERGTVAAHSPTLVGRIRQDPSLILKAAESLIRGKAVSSYKKLSEKARSPKPLGYSLSGIVVGVGQGVEGIMPGMRVACGGTKFAHHAETVAVPVNLCVPVPEGADPKDAAFVSVGAIAIHALRRAGLGMGETVAIVGLGLIGSLAALIGRASGLRVTGVERNPKRISLARELGFEVFGPEEAAGAVPTITGGQGADAVLICTSGGGSDVVNLGFEMARPGARVVLVGNTEVSGDRRIMYEKELELVMATSYGPGRYDPTYEEKGIDYPLKYVRWTERRNMEHFLRLVAEGSVLPYRDLKPRIFPIASAAEAYAELEKENPPIAILFSYELENIPAPIKAAAPKTRGKIGVALVGPGRFARETHLPLLASSPDFQIRHVVASSGEKALETSRIYGASASTLQEALEDPEVNLVFITTRHDSHAEITIKALEAGKPVFVEKPLAINAHQLERIIETQRRAGLPVVVGFNRRYSPLSAELRSFIRTHRPSTLVYRVNAGALPLDHWLYDPEIGGGRLIGEGCHFLDYLVFVFGKDFTLLEATGNKDEFTVSVGWPDGSLGVVIYSGRGSRKMPKERIEVMGQGSSAVLEDFVSLILYEEDQKEIRLPDQDKGHKEQIRLIANLIRGREPVPLAFEEAVSSTLLTLAASEALSGERWISLP